MYKELTNWDVILNFEQFDDHTDEYGPYTQQVVNLCAAFDTIAWFRHAGSDAPGDIEVHNVTTWGEAIRPMLDPNDLDYFLNGQLEAPTAILDEVRLKRKYAKHVRRGMKEAMKYLDYENYVPVFLEKHEREFMRTYMESFVENIILEIVSQDEGLPTTYFREMLMWFECGHMPCGWLGEWPDGMFRVF